MLQIRNEQLAAFRRQREEEFFQRAHRHLCEIMAAAGRLITPEELAPQVREGIRQAASLGITAQCDVVEYLTIVCLFLGGFERLAPSLQERAFLTAGGTPADRLQRLRAWAQSTRKGAR